MVFTSVMKPLHTKRGGVCILEAKIIDPEFGSVLLSKEQMELLQKDLIELKLTITHCPYCETPLKFLFQNLVKSEKDS